MGQGSDTVPDTIGKASQGLPLDKHSSAPSHPGQSSGDQSVKGEARLISIYFYVDNI